MSAYKPFMNPIDDQPPTPPRLRPWSVAALVALAGLLGALIGGGVVFMLAAPRLRLPEAPPTPSAFEIEQKEISVEINSAITEAVDRVSSAVVTVVSYYPKRRVFGGIIEPKSTGSGFIISPEGYIVTNNHVVEGGTRFEIILIDGRTLPATLVGAEPYADLAVLRAEGDLPTVAEWGNSDLFRPGESVIAIGSPLGDFTNTVTVGVISAVERRIEVSKDFFLEGLIQTDAAINQGNSGGPLINLSGQVIGVNTLIVRGSENSSAVAEGLGFAIPSNIAHLVSEQIIQQGYFARPYLGIRWVWITPQLAERYGLPVKMGVYISEVIPDSPAERGGLQRGDILISIMDENFDEEHPFRNLLFKYRPGDEVTFRLVRDGELILKNIVLGEIPNR